MQAFSRIARRSSEALNFIVESGRMKKSGLQSIVRLLKQVADAPMTAITFFDEADQHFFVSEGLDLERTPIEDSFCRDCLASGEPLFVSDASTDPRYRFNRLVTGAPGLRSYVGVPVRELGGKDVAVLCALSDKADAFDPGLVERMQSFAKIVESIVEFRATEKELSKVSSILADRTSDLAEAQTVFRQIEKLGKLGFWQIDLTDDKVMWSDGVWRIHGRDPAKGITIADALEYYCEEDRLRVADHLAKAIETGDRFNYEASIVSDTGERKQIVSVGEKIRLANGRQRMVGLVEDVSERHQLYAEAKRNAEVDSLTGLRNRRAFEGDLACAIAKFDEWKTPNDLIFFDLDNFKDINSSYGHVIGDFVLQEIGRRMRCVLPAGYLCSRWGGDEFAIITPQGGNGISAEDVCRELAQKIVQPIHIRSRTVEVEATFGIAALDKSLDCGKLVRRADLALMYGKAEQKGSVTRYSQIVARQAETRLSSVALLRDSIRAGRIFGAYQPIVDLDDGQIVGFESLLRCYDVTGEIRPAAMFMPALENPEISRKVLQFMTRQVCEDIKAIEAGFADFQYVSINASEIDILSREFVEGLSEALDDCAIDPVRIMIEFTETVLLANDNKRIRAVLDAIKAMGCLIALDDFGTGFSSLSHLRDFPIDKVKIDRSFVSGIHEDRVNRKIVEGIVAMCEGNDIVTIAEGIEDSREIEVLRDLGCRRGQGYYFSEPRKLNAFLGGGLNSKSFAASNVHSLRRAQAKRD